MKSKIAVLGASYLQKPLIEKAKELGHEIHVFAWREGNVVEDFCDCYYDISILDQDKILSKCQELGIDGIISIASDIAMPAVNYVASKLNLVGNPIETTLKTTDKFEMRSALKQASIFCPTFTLHTATEGIDVNDYSYPVIVKPTDRSGSRGVTKVESSNQLLYSIRKALESSIKKRVIVEEFIQGREFSVETISYKGKHHFLAITDKITTGPPHFVEIAHHQPAEINSQLKSKIELVTNLALSALSIENGASHTEVLVNGDQVAIVEVAGRMGGDFIGSTLTSLSTGIDTLSAVINIALGNKPNLISKASPQCSGVHFLTKNRKWVEETINKKPEFIYQAEIFDNIDEEDLNNSSNRRGYFIYKSSKRIDHDDN